MQTDTQSQTYHTTSGGLTQYSQTTTEPPIVSARVPLETHGWRVVPRRILAIQNEEDIN
jgi:hypothetical protein